MFEPAEEGGFIVTFPALPGLVTEGDTREEASGRAAEALRGYRESLALDGKSAPESEIDCGDLRNYTDDEIAEMRRVAEDRRTWLEQEEDPHHQ